MVFRRFEMVNNNLILRAYNIMSYDPFIYKRLYQKCRQKNEKLASKNQMLEKELLELYEKFMEYKSIVNTLLAPSDCNILINPTPEHNDKELPYNSIHTTIKKRSNLTKQQKSPIQPNNQTLNTQLLHQQIRVQQQNSKLKQKNKILLRELKQLKGQQQKTIEKTRCQQQFKNSGKIGGEIQRSFDSLEHDRNNKNSTISKLLRLQSQAAEPTFIVEEQIDLGNKDPYIKRSFTRKKITKRNLSDLSLRLKQPKKFQSDLSYFITRPKVSIREISQIKKYHYSQKPTQQHDWILSDSEDAEDYRPK